MSLLFIFMLVVGILSDPTLAASPQQQKTTTLQGRLQFPDGDGAPFNATTRVTLNHGEVSTYSRADGTFVLYDVKPGIHVIDVHNPVYHFGQVKCQVLEDHMDEPPKCLEYAFAGAAKRPVSSYPIVMTTVATYDYFEKRSGFSIFFIFKNPMILMMLFSVGMMVRYIVMQNACIIEVSINWLA